MVAARPDKNYRLISYSYYTKDTSKGDSTSFTHLDINVGKLVESGRSINIIQSSLSLDDKDENGCMILVPGFHQWIAEWCCALLPHVQLLWHRSADLSYEDREAY